MEKITTVGLDLAKSVFQVHGIARDVTWLRDCRKSLLQSPDFCA